MGNSHRTSSVYTLHYQPPFIGYIIAPDGKRCPIEKFKSELIEKNILTCSLAKKISDKIDSEIEEAVKFAEESPYPETREALDDLFFEGALR